MNKTKHLSKFCQNIMELYGKRCCKFCRKEFGKTPYYFYINAKISIRTFQFRENLIINKGVKYIYLLCLKYFILYLLKNGHIFN